MHQASERSKQAWRVGLRLLLQEGGIWIGLERNHVSIAIRDLKRILYSPAIMDGGGWGLNQQCLEIHGKDRAMCTNCTVPLSVSGAMSFFHYHAGQIGALKPFAAQQT